MKDKMKQIFWMIVEAIVFILLISFIWGYYSRKLETSEQNLKAATSQISEMKLKNDDLLVARDSYIATIDDLENLLDITKKEVKEIQRKLDSKIAYISELETNVRIEYVEVVKDSIIYVNNNPKDIVAQFHYTDEWVNLKGESKINFENEFTYNTTLNDINIYTPLTVGLTDDYQIFVTTSNPYVNFSDINGAVIDKSKLYPKKKKFNWGLQGGLGIMYNVVKNDVAVGPYLGVGAEYNF
jgi:hypothetical protein